MIPRYGEYYTSAGAESASRRIVQSVICDPVAILMYIEYIEHIGSLLQIKNDNERSNT